MSAKSAVEDNISGSSAKKTVVFSKSYCPYCKSTKDLLDSLKVDYDVYELDQMEEGSDWQAYLAEKTGQRTVPSVFIGQKHIGGNSDLQALHKKGELQKLVN
ncbi:hypothetical protein JCM11251_003123 [Rhodosporidiobolus azoricus]